MTENEWKKVKDFMLPYEGLASQFYVLDIPRAKIEHILRSVDILTKDAKVPVVGSHVLDSKVELAHVNQGEYLDAIVEGGQTTICTNVLGYADITFDLWVVGDKEHFDLEVWFWADQFFTDSDIENQSRFGALLSLVKCTISSTSYRCILTPSEADDPRIDLASGNAVEIDIGSA